jgi:hypothetical protein
MSWGMRRGRNLGDKGGAELDARLTESWEAGAAVVGRTLDLQAGREALLADLGLSRESAGDHLAPAALTAGTGPRKRHLVRGSMVGVAAAAVAAGVVALAAVVLPGAGTPGLGRPGYRATGGSAVTAAYVVKQVDRALSGAGSGEVAQVRITTDGRTSAMKWSYGDQSRSITYLVSGQPLDDVGFSTSSANYTLVNYQKHVWTRQDRPSSPSPPPGSFPPGSGACKAVLRALTWVFQPGLRIQISDASTPATVASALRAAVSCGALAMAGRQRVDGIGAIELTSRPGSLIPETIWVSPDTYLPVRVTARLASLQRTADITWLQPTAQNLDKLTVPIPAGFRQVSLSRAVGPVTQQIPGGPPTPR